MQSVATRARTGFTLIELLVVIATIALLIGLLLPALGKARCGGKVLNEQSVGHQQLVGYAAYYTDSRDKLLPGSAHWVWNHAPPNAINGLYPPDPWYPGHFMEGSITKTWPWHFMGVMNYKPEGIQIDKPTFSDFLKRQQAPTTTSYPYTKYASNSFQAAIGWHPTLGYNAVYVGGSYQHGGFCGQPPGNDWGGSDASPAMANPQVSGGQFYVDLGYKVQQPSTLIIFASARGGDVIQSSSFWGWGGANPDGNPVVPGYWLVRPPRAHPTGQGSFRKTLTLGGGWATTSNKWDPKAVPSTWGNLRANCNERVVTARFDGSVGMEKLEGLRDMRKWSNYADKADWDFKPGP